MIARIHGLRRRFGIGWDVYQELFEQSSGTCYICGIRPGKGQLHIDHNHTTQKIRGLLCVKCNQGVGQFNDSSFLLVKAAQYCAVEV